MSTHSISPKSDSVKLTRPQLIVLRIIAGEISADTQPRRRPSSAIIKVFALGLIEQVTNPGQPSWSWHYELTPAGIAALKAVQS